MTHLLQFGGQPLILGTLVLEIFDRLKVLALLIHQLDIEIRQTDSQTPPNT